jgi:hypothetical protein
MRAALLLPCSALLLAAAAPARAAPAEPLPGANPRPILHFDLDASAGRRRLVLRATERGGRRLATFEGANGASWAPDGRWFAFFTVDAAGPSGALAVMNLAGESRRLVELGPGERFLGWQPAYSPDGGRIAALVVPVRDGKAAEPLLAVLDVAGGRIAVRHRLPTGVVPVLYPAVGKDKLCWSPDGTRILVSWQGLAVVEAASGRVQLHLEQPVVAEWAAASDALWYLGLSARERASERALTGLFAQRLGQTGPLLLADGKALAAAGLVAARSLAYAVTALSPSGERLAVAAGGPGSAGGTLRIHEVGPGRPPAPDRPARSFPTRGIVTALEWSPDGSALALVQAGVEGVAVEVLDLGQGSWRTLASFELRAAEVEVLGGKNLSWSR